MQEDKSTTAKKQARVILWTHPRSRSTAFEFCVNSLENIETIHEPFIFATFVGADRELYSAQWSRHGYDFPIIPGYSFAEVRQRLEADYPDKAAVFSKDCAAAFAGRSMGETLPRGYLNTFLIREPESTVVSFHKVITRQMEEIPECRDFKPIEELAAISLRYKDVYDLYLYVTNVMKQPGIIVDSDDLCADPEGILRQYCEKTGLDFDPEKMLNWKANIDHFEEISKNGALKIFHEVALKTNSGFTKTTKDVDAFQKLPEELKKFAQEQKKYYDLLYEKRIRTD